MGKSFQKIHACSVGNFGDNTDKIPQWIKANGGVYVKEINDSVTHLVASEAAVKKNVEAVRKAKRLKHIKIVTYDWLEDSLQSKTRRPKREGPYLWDRILKEQKKKAAKDSKVQISSNKKTKTKTKKKNQRGVNAAKSLEDFAKGARAIVSEMESSGYHLYTDQKTGVTYCATLVRPSVVKGRKEKYLAKSTLSQSGPIFSTQILPRNHLLRVPIYNPFAQQLQLYESDATPHVYATYVKYSRVGASGKQLLAPRGSSLDLALTVFKKFFQTKTGLRWEEQYDDSKTPEPKRDARGEPVPADDGLFQFERPTGLLASLKVEAEIESVNEETQTQQITASYTTGPCTTTRCDETVDDTRVEGLAVNSTINPEIVETDDNYREPNQDCRFQRPASVDSNINSDSNDPNGTADTADEETGSSQTIDFEEEQEHQQSSPELCQESDTVID